MKKIQLIGLALLAAVTLSNCKKDAPAGPTGPPGNAGPALTGNLKGHITLWDQFNGRILANQAGDTVSIDGTSLKTTTDSTGYYVFAGISTGTYNLTITKPGFGMMKSQNIEFVGGGDTYRDARIGQPSTFNATGLADSVGATSGNVTVYGTVPTDPHGRSFIIYVGSSSAVSSNPTTFLYYNTKNINPNVTKLSFTIPLTDLQDAGFVTGASVYFAVYGINSGFNNTSSYEDFPTGRTVFTGLSSTPATWSLVMP
jgi:hypothetical protein